MRGVQVASAPRVMGWFDFALPACSMAGNHFMNHPGRRVVFSEVFLFGLLSMLVSLCVTFPLFHRSLSDANQFSVGSVLMFLSSVICLNLAYVVVLSVLAMARVPKLIVAILAVVIASALQIFLVADVKIFSFFKFHLNGLVLNFLTTEGAGDSLKLGMATLTSYVLVCLALIGLEVFLARRAFYSPDSLKSLRRRAGTALACLVVVVVADKATYAYADLTNKTSILSAARYYPLYSAITVKHLAVKWFGYQLNRERDVALTGGGRTLNYPRQPLVFAEGAPRYNVLFLLADGFRSDMLNPEVTPHLYEFAQHTLNFRNHFSGGNGTRFGVFSMLYGLYANLWDPFLAARQSPVLIDALRNLNYQFTVLDSTRLTFPEFRKTVFVSIPDSISDEHPEPAMFQRDAALVSEFHQFLERRDTARPFFGFVFFNSSHPFYQYPKEFERFTPVVKAINYMGSLTPEKELGLKNRYQNALFYTDTLFQKVIDDLQGHGLLDNTILIVTGDHGEEFNENGYCSHNSAFDDYQIKTTFVMKLPHEAPRKIAALTSAIDIVPTILSRLGCTTPAAEYSHGRDLLSVEPRSFVFATDWDSGAIVTETERAIVPVGSAKVHFVEVRTARDYKLVEDKDAVKKYRPMMLEVAMGLSRFLK